MTYDKRLTPAREDLAAKHLEGTIDAPRYAEGKPREVRAAFAPLKSTPDGAASMDTMLLFGERFTVYDDAGGWLWGQAERDGYVGYAPAAAFDEPGKAQTHMVSALATHLYPEPDVKASPVGGLYMTSMVRQERREGDFAALAGGLYLPAAHLSRVGSHARDFASVAEMFIGAPYLWGGKTLAGLDCSALVQVSMRRAGLDAPRDSDMQERTLGKRMASEGPFQRGDLVFWEGHVGVMIDAETLLHANAHHMQVAVEPLDRAAARIKRKGGGGITSVKRPDRLSASGK